MRIPVILSVFFICLSLGLSAQDLKGHVENARSKEGIPYVNIGIPSKAFGFITDESGSFIFRITSEKETDTLQISSIGYKPLIISLKQFRSSCENNQPFLLEEIAYQLETTTVRPNEYETKVLGSKNVADLECINLKGEAPKDTATQRKYREKGLSEKSVGVEIGNKISIDKGQQTFVDHVQFKTCLEPNDTAIYRVNIYAEGKTLEKHFTPIGMVRIMTMENVVKQPVIVKCIGKTEVHDIDLSAQNIEVQDDFIIALECIYSSNQQMRIGAKTNIFGATDLLIRESVMDEWIKIPLLDITFVSATVIYKKKKGFFARLFN